MVVPLRGTFGLVLTRLERKRSVMSMLVVIGILVWKD